MTKLADLEVTDSELARLLGCSARLIRKLAEEGKITRVARNRFQLGAALPVIVAHLHGGAGSAKELMAERVRKLAADATLAELQLAKAKGEVALVSEFQRGWEVRCAMTKARMLQVPQRAVVQLVGETDQAKIKAVLTSEIREALQAASEEQIEPEEFENDEDDTDCN